MIRWYAPARYLASGTVIQCGPESISREHAEDHVAVLINDGDVDVFVAFRDITAWKPTKGKASE